MLSSLWRALWSRRPGGRAAEPPHAPAAGERGASGGAHESPARIDDPETLNRLGAERLDAQDLEGAVAAFRSAVEARPDFAEACGNLAYALVLQEDCPDEALAWARRATQFAPQRPDPYCNLAMVLQHLNRSEESLEAAETALRLAPGHAQARYGRALALLALGRFAEGWPAHEARREILRSFRLPRYPYPEWRGEDLAGRTLLVYAEQGLGDEIMFASCLPEVISRAGHCLIECSPRLQPIFARSFPAATVTGAEQTARDLAWPQRLALRVDCQTPAGTLPLYLRREWSEFPRHQGYLVADPGRRRRWRSRLDALGSGLKVGISWRGGPRAAGRSARSIPLADWAPLLAAAGAAAHFVSLQYTDCADEVAAVNGRLGVRIHHWQEAIDSYDDTAALVAELDLVIAVRTAVIHLAGALGRRAWVLVPAGPGWRYLAAGEALPWYPSVRMFRQARFWEWAPVIERVAQELREFVR